MPRVADEVLDCAIYLYPSENDAEAGKAVGGTGFLASVPSETHQDAWYVYAITNWHVVDPFDGNSPVVRLNTQGGGFDVVELAPEQWTRHPDWDDIAACFIGLSRDLNRFKCVPTTRFMTDRAIQANDVGVGDETFMVGRFITHEGRQRNWPTLRFGNIAMMNHEPVHFRNRNQEAFLVEARSLSGFSGAPVFVHIPPLTVRPRSGGEIDSLEYRWWLLGIDCGHLPKWQAVVDEGQKPIPQDYQVELNTGMMVVIPAWKIAGLLQDDSFVSERKGFDEIDREPRRSTAVQDSVPDEL
jgi:hypothetical protein